MSAKQEENRKMNTELMEALDILEKEKDISRDTLFEAIENSLITACRNNYGRSENILILKLKLYIIMIKE